MPAKRVLISVEERILERIDDAARRNGLTRSRFLAQAAIAQIEAYPRGGDGRETSEVAADPSRR